jgi:hypothetical protein
MLKGKDVKNYFKLGDEAVFPVTYYTYGFNQNVTDTVIYVNIVPSNNITAAATTMCGDKFIRPLYS